jgi:transcriptional regulator with XRE-family HTH domain
MKQVELAKQLGISKSYLSMILSGKRMPNPELARRISSLKVHNFEPISSLRGRCPKPLDECAIYYPATKCSQLDYSKSLSHPLLLCNPTGRIIGWALKNHVELFTT